ncbi:MAG: CPBP family intramembrane glutamic endopeptidase [Pricia sp.]
METIHKHTGWVRVIALIVPYFVITAFFQVMGYLAIGADFSGPKPTLTTIEHTWLAGCTFLGTFLVLWLFMTLVDKEKMVSMGFQVKERGREFWFGNLIGLAIMGVAFFLLMAIGEIEFQKFNFDMVEMLLTILLFVLVAVMEEVLFRGYILKNLMISFNKYVALIISSILFSVAHAANPHFDWMSFLDLFMAGLFLGISYIHTKNLWFPIALHLSWNLFQSLFGFNVSGQDAYSLIEINIPEGNWINGGDFGFEGSVFSILIQIFFVIALVFYYERKTGSERDQSQGKNPDVIAVESGIFEN